MPRFSVVTGILVVALAACASPPPDASTPAPTEAPVVTPPGTAAASRSATPPSEPPAAAATAPTEASAPVEPSADERYLLAGTRSDLTDCRPVRDRLPPRATAGIECAADDPAVARVGLYLFDTSQDMLNAYFARMDAEGVERNGGSCEDEEAEGAYIPGDGEIEERHGCFVNDEGYANYRATVPWWNGYIGVLGRTADMAALHDFAWRGNQDTPGNPTLWAGTQR